MKKKQEPAFPYYKPHCSTIFPIENLDYPNHSYANEIVLFTYPFVSVSYIDLIQIGSSDSNVKVLQLKQLPKDCKFHLVPTRYKDTFAFTQNGDTVSVTRTDVCCGWGFNHYVYVYCS